MTAPLLTVDRLALRLPVGGELRPVLHDVGFRLEPGQALGLVGESGSGKSMTARVLLRLLPPGAEARGSVSFDGRDVLALSGASLVRHRAEDVAMVFQDPRAVVNPVRRCGDLLTETLVHVRGVPSARAAQQAVAALAEVGIAEPDRCLRQYPHELSGGMLQRVMIAAALLARPRLLLADEPTTALDVTTQAEVVALLARLCRERGMAMLFITHDIELATAICDAVAVMYAGSIVERVAAARLLEASAHPYTRALMDSRPSTSTRRERLPAIPGQPLAAFQAPPGCAFAGRCAHAEPACETAFPAPITHPDGFVRCVRAPELAGGERGAWR